MLRRDVATSFRIPPGRIPPWLATLLVGIGFTASLLMPDGGRAGSLLLALALGAVVGSDLVARVTPPRSLGAVELGPGIGDARSFAAFVERAFAAPNPKLGLLFIELRQVALLRSTFGLEAVDDLCVTLARRLHGQLRRSDAFAHLGDGVFALALEAIDDRVAFDVIAGRLRDRLAAPLSVLDMKLEPEFDIAAVLAPEDGNTAVELLSAGEASRELARTPPGEPLRRLRPASRGDHGRRRARLRELMAAKTNGAFFPVFQPQLDLRTGGIERVEVLMRWQRADGSVAGPGLFLAELAEMGALPSVSREVYASAFAEAALWLADGHALERLALNLDASQVVGDDWADGLLEDITASPLPPTAVEFEVSENILEGADLELLTRGLARLREAGVGVSLDDFGKGFASLAQIASLPIDLVKIDARLLWDAADGGRSRAVIEGTVALMDRLGLPCVFEGIETAIHLDIARRLGGCTAQGFFIGRPMAGPDLEAMLRGHASPLSQAAACRTPKASTVDGAKPAATTTPSTT